MDLIVTLTPSQSSLARLAIHEVGGSVNLPVVVTPDGDRSGEGNGDVAGVARPCS